MSWKQSQIHRKQPLVDWRSVEICRWCLIRAINHCNTHYTYFNVIDIAYCVDFAAIDCDGCGETLLLGNPFSSSPPPSRWLPLYSWHVYVNIIWFQHSFFLVSFGLLQLLAPELLSSTSTTSPNKYLFETIRKDKFNATSSTDVHTHTFLLKLVRRHWSVFYLFVSSLIRSVRQFIQIEKSWYTRVCVYDTLIINTI